MSPVPPARSRSANGRSVLVRRTFDGSRRHQDIFPGPVQPARHQVVHQVVAVCHAVKDVVDQRLLVGERHLAEAEIVFPCRQSSSTFDATMRARGRRYIVLAGPDHRSGLGSAELTVTTRLTIASHPRRPSIHRNAILMPELPEVETVRRGLAPVMEGARFVDGRGAARRPALAAAEGFRRAAQGQDRDRPRPARKISARGPLLRRCAADASWHVGLVPRCARSGRGDARRLSS